MNISKTQIVSALALCACGVAVSATLDDAIMSRAALLVFVALALWLTEILPLFVPTLLLLVGIPLMLADLNAEFAFSAVLKWPVQPVMALFFGGFALGAAGQKHGIDSIISHWTAALAGSSRLRLLFAVMASTAILSMWMSNIAASAMMIAALRPLWRDLPDDDNFRRALLLGVAFGADFGGMGTPVGSGPNALAVAASQIDFLDWMLLAIPITIGMLAVAYLLLVWLHGVRGHMQFATIDAPRPTVQAWAVAILFTLAVIFWVSEPLHKVSSAITALASRQRSSASDC